MPACLSDDDEGYTELDSDDWKALDDAVWSDECRWPRRLLHVDTLTSHPWRPGHRYGCHTAPRYNALSYTWGRWQLRPDDPTYGTTPALPVRGTSWPLPRIDRNHFAAEDLLAAVRAAAVCHGTPVEFVWLDVACIDQTPTSPEYASEIGRQAAIFHGAQAVFIWLATTPRAALHDWALELEQWVASRTMTLRDLEEEEEAAGEDEEQERPVPTSEDLRRQMDDAVRLVRFLSRDAWFSSLWTLQEAFLAPNAILLGRDGPEPRLVQGPEGATATTAGARLYVCRLRDFSQACIKIKDEAAWLRKHNGRFPRHDGRTDGGGPDEAVLRRAAEAEACIRSYWAIKGDEMDQFFDFAPIVLRPIDLVFDPWEYLYGYGDGWAEAEGYFLLSWRIDLLVHGSRHAAHSQCLPR